MLIGSKSRGQAAVEFLFTYTWAFMIIAIIIGVLLYFLSIPQTLIPPRCSFPYGIECRGIIIGSNSVATQVYLILINAQQYDLVGPTNAMINTSSYGSANAICNPSNSISGGTILCSGSLSSRILPSHAVSGSITFNSFVCLSGSAQNCQSERSVTYLGNFSGYSGSYTGGLPVSMTLYKSEASTGASAPVLFTANVRIMGMPAEGAAVEFTTNAPTSATMEPTYSLSWSDGNATSYFSSPTSGSYNVIASFVGISASNVITVN